MIGLSRWCITHRKWVIGGWIAIAIVTTVIASAVGRQYATNFSLPGTEAQHVTDLLNKEFKSASGDVDTIVFHSANEPVTSPAVKNAIEPLLASVSKMPHVVSVESPYGSAGAVEISHDGHTAFATINYDKRANLLADSTGKPVLDAVNAVHVPGLTVAAGGQVIEQAEGFSIGPATAVGVAAALVILLLTFGSLIAAGMPLITAGLGLISGIALVGLATHITDMSSVAPELAIMIGLGVGIDYALFIVTRFRENFGKTGDVDAAVIGAMDTSGPRDPACGHDRHDRAAGDVRHRRELHVWPGDRFGAGRPAGAQRVADGPAGAALALGRSGGASKPFRSARAKPGEPRRASPPGVAGA